MEQTRALNALEPFLALSKSANSPRAAADLVSQATSAPNTYVFAELLQTPNMQALRQSTEYASHLTLLEIFAWGTLADYKANPSLPPLNAQQHQKLLLLSLLPLARSHTTLTYAHLTTALSLPSPRALEELITTAIYASLLTATLDPAHGLVNVSSISPLRDLAPGALPALSATLAAWSARAGGALDELDAQIAGVRRAAVLREKERRKRERGMETAMALLEEKSGGAKRGPGGNGEEGGGGAGEAMEIDQEDIVGRDRDDGDEVVGDGPSAKRMRGDVAVDVAGGAGDYGGVKEENGKVAEDVGDGDYGGMRNEKSEQEALKMLDAGGVEGVENGDKDGGID
ncbi:uncharacterized protein BDZ99DRAFT_473784 [Mytilinidion resinicola]|uniref:PCI domain-containing protein n=1 Tax=Mytilinidion resinicola TaxID=574789 RepID=A0A6A6YW85_9PEZI|nr:uncharacterized protein BDZ99DRAFT_473784 [Mytilinidion resinicola]KAF2813061.1 hypothetical protein BDZ99DRAFT_473784 [Mytilinidion resinicola]